MDEKIYLCLFFLPLLDAATSKYCIKESSDWWVCNYVPADIPPGITKVKLIDFYSNNGITQINNSHFQSENWRQVKRLELLDDTVGAGELHLMTSCFGGLRRLLELKIFIIDYINHFDPGLFLKLDNVQTLDLSGCTRLDLRRVLPALTGSEKLPRLEKLLLSNVGASIYPSSFDMSFTRALKGKNITHLDVSRSQIAMFNITSCTKDLKQLKVLNVSYSTVSETYHKGTEVSDVLHIDMLDVSYAVAPKSLINGPIGKLVLSNYTIENIDSRNHLNKVFAVETINASAVVSELNSIWIEKCKMFIDKPVSWHTKYLVARYNNLKRLDVAMQCEKYKLRNFEHLDIANNGLEFLHSSVFKCLPNLSKVDLSNNHLHKMAEEDEKSFGKLVHPLSALRFLSLSSNGLETIASKFFENNLKLEQIDLSGNRLRHVTFKIDSLKKLRFLNLNSNHIQILDGNSLNILNSIHPDSNIMDSRTVLLLENNPFSCSECKTKDSIQWLYVTTLYNLTQYNLLCENEAGENVKIDGGSVKQVQKICTRKKVITSLSIVAGVLVLIMSVSAFFVYKRRKYLKMRKIKDAVLQNLIEGQGQFEFVTFLSFSSDDKDFVDLYIYNQLNENLRIMTGTDRNLVCVGDEYLRPGFLVLDETARCIERASVMIAVVSNSYCDSPFCHNELDQAYRLNKPIVLMLKDHVDENLMMPIMKALFKNNVRILWGIENGEYVLKTTWENVCTSILDLIANRM